MAVLDIHTHCLEDKLSDSIINHSALDISIPLDAIYYSLSVHPWYLTEENVGMQLDFLKTCLDNDTRMVAIGECGIDKLCKTPFELQVEVFDKIADIAAESGLPLIIHSVKASNEIIESRKRTGSDNVWIIHGFRGKRELANEYMRHGIMLSFGRQYNVDALHSVPLEKLFIESDEASCPMDEMVNHISADYGITPEYLKEKVSENVSRYFPRIN